MVVLYQRVNQNGEAIGVREKSLMIAVSKQYISVTDRDRLADTRRRLVSRLRIALRGKKKQAIGGRPSRYVPVPVLPRGRQSALCRRADGNVAAVSHGQHVHTPTAAAA